ncbi:MAG: AsmA family protein [Hyphomicrobium aestuarii]|nr:AsmA family protein [Hyphomicrobium aestuarii]
MNNVLLTIGALLVGILAALAAVPMLVDWNSYRGVFEEEASRILGRDVRVGGSVAVRLLPAPFVRFEKLRVADTASTSGDPLFRADSLTMRLSVGALLRGALQADNVELKKPALRLSADKDGNGNWRTLQIAPGSLPFLPADVALRSVGVLDGSLTIVGPSGKDAAMFETINGEFAAESANGPFRFKGTANQHGGGAEPATAREIRVSAGAFEPDGSLKLRASVRAPTSGNSYAFDGRLTDIRDDFKIEGDLTAKLPIMAATLKDRKSADGRLEDGAEAYELKGKLAGDINGARLTDLSLALDSPTDPQLITGEISTVWGLAPRFDMALSSKSLNLDRFAAAGPDSDPLDTARAALNIVLGALPADADANARLKADRVVIAGEAVTGVAVAMARNGPVLELKSLRAELPGSTRLEANGVVSRDTRTLAFSGPVRAKGANLARFLAWARGKDRTLAALTDPARATNATSSPRRYEGPFSLDGQLAMAGGSMDLTSVTADFNGMAVTGEFKVQTEGRRKIALTIDAPRLDMVQLWPGGFDVRALRKALTGSARTASFVDGDPPTADVQPGDAGFFFYDPAAADLTLDVKAGELRLGSTGKPPVELRNIDIALAIDRGTLTVERMRMTAPTGLEADIEGRISGLPGSPSTSGPSGSPLPVASTARSGTLRFVIHAPTAGAITEAFDAADVPAALRPGDAFLTTLGRTRIAGTVVLGSGGLGARGLGASGLGASGPGGGANGGAASAKVPTRPATSVDITFDGSIDQGRVSGSVLFERGLHDWRSATLVATLNVDSPRVERWLELPGLTAAQTDGAKIAGRGTLFLRAEGTPETAMTVYTTLASPDLSAAYQGVVVLPKEQPARVDGLVALTARDAADVLALAGISPTIGASGAPVAGQVRITNVTDGMRFETSGLAVGGSTLTGVATVSKVVPAGGGGTSGGASAAGRMISARLAVDTLSVPGVLAALSDRRAAKTDGDEALWPADPLTLSTLDGVTGSIEINSARAVIDGAVGLSDVRATVTLSAGSFVLDAIEGTALGGTFQGKAALSRVGGGSQFTADGTFARLDSARFSSGTKIPLSVSANVSGKGISARGIVASLAGTGEATLGAGKIAGVAPAAVTEVANRVLDSRELPSMEQASAEIIRLLETSVLDVRARKLAITIGDGSARLASPPFETDAGQARLNMTIDLLALRHAHDWRIEAKTKRGPSGRVKPLMPPVVIATSGNLAASDNWTTAVNLSAFEQELSLRKLERDGEELERARKLAEEARLKAEAEAEDAERRAAVKAAEDAAAQAAKLSSDSDRGTGSQPAPVQPLAQPAAPGATSGAAPGATSGAATAAPQAKPGPASTTATVPISAPPPPRLVRPSPRPPDDSYLRPFQNP